MIRRAAESTKWCINLLKILESCKVSRWKVCGWTVQCWFAYGLFNFSLLTASSIVKTVFNQYRPQSWTRCCEECMPFSSLPWCKRGFLFCRAYKQESQGCRFCKAKQCCSNLCSFLQLFKYIKYYVGTALFKIETKKKSTFPKNARLFYVNSSPSPPHMQHILGCKDYFFIRSIQKHMQLRWTNMLQEQQPFVLGLQMSQRLPLILFLRFEHKSTGQILLMRRKIPIGNPGEKSHTVTKF